MLQATYTPRHFPRDRLKWNRCCFNFQMKIELGTFKSKVSSLWHVVPSVVPRSCLCGSHALCKLVIPLVWKGSWQHFSLHLQQCLCFCMLSLRFFCLQAIGNWKTKYNSSIATSKACTKCIHFATYNLPIVAKMYAICILSAIPAQPSQCISITRPSHPAQLS